MASFLSFGHGSIAGAQGCVNEDPVISNETVVLEECAEDISKGDLAVSSEMTFVAENVCISEFLVTGMSCASCASRIELSFKNLPGVQSASVNFATLTCTVHHDSCRVDVPRLIGFISSLGYGAELKFGSLNRDTVVSLVVGGMSCASCAARLEQAIRKIPQVKNCNVNFATSTCSLTLDSREDLRCVEDTILSMGYTVTVKDDTDLSTIARTKEVLERTEEIDEHKRQFVGAAILATPLAVIMLLMSATDLLERPHIMKLVDGMQVALTTPIVFYFGSGFFVRAWQGLKHMSCTMDTLVAIGTGCSYIFSVGAFIVTLLTPHHMTAYFDTVGMLLAFMLLGRYLEARAKRSTSDALIELMNLVPPVATVVTPDGDVTMPSAFVQRGMRLRVLAGDRVPVDGVILEGISDVDEQLITGESIPKTVKPGAAVVGGTTNVTAMFLMEARRVGEETTLAQILRVVQEAQNSKPTVQRIADRIAAYFVPFVVAFSILVLTAWLALGYLDAYPSEWRGSDEPPAVFALNFFIASLVVACPCALGLATPTAIMVGTGVGAKNGVLVKSGITLEVVRRSRCVVFDKTGTITSGKLRIVFTNCAAENVTDVKNAVGSVEEKSNHPVAKAVASGLLLPSQPSPYDVVHCETISGLGAVAVVSDRRDGVRHTVHVGSIALMEREGVEVALATHQAVRRQSDLGRTIVIGAIDHVATLVIALSDEPKEEARGVLRFLRQRNFRTLMVTGDNRGTAAHVARDVGIPLEDVHAEALPATKAAIVRQLQADGEIVIFVGDGINDSPALAQANVGVALGAGTDIAIEAADAVLVRNSLVDLINLRALSIATVNRVYGNFAWALCYNLVMLPFASGILFPLLHTRIPPIFAGAAMVLSSLSVLTSSLSLRCFRPKKKESFYSVY